MQKRGTLTLAVVLILLGAFLLLNELGVAVPGWDTIWPVFPLAGGLALLAGYIFGQRHEPGRVFVGTAATLVALVFFFILGLQSCGSNNGHQQFLLKNRFLYI